MTTLKHAQQSIVIFSMLSIKCVAAGAKLLESYCKKEQPLLIALYHLHPFDSKLIHFRVQHHLQDSTNSISPLPIQFECEEQMISHFNLCLTNRFLRISFWL